MNRFLSGFMIDSDIICISEERKFRLESLVSMHSQCQNKIQDLSNQLVAQNEQYQADKAAWERQSQEGKVSGIAMGYQERSL